MPIVRKFQPRSPVLGHFLMGHPKQANRPGADLMDKFRFAPTTNDPQKRARQLQEMSHILGGNPCEAIFGTIVTDDPSQFYIEQNEEWQPSLRRLVCDGETISMQLDPMTGAISRDLPCRRLSDDPKLQCRCKPTGRLYFAIPEFTSESGLFMLATHSFYSCSRIRACVDEIVRRTSGNIMNLPILITRNPSPTKKEIKDGKTTEYKTGLVTVSFQPEFARQNAEHLQPTWQPIDQYFLDNGEDQNDLSLLEAEIFTEDE